MPSFPSKKIAMLFARKKESYDVSIINLYTFYKVNEEFSLNLGKINQMANFRSLLITFKVRSIFGAARCQNCLKAKLKLLKRVKQLVSETYYHFFCFSSEFFCIKQTFLKEQFFQGLIFGHRLARSGLSFTNILTYSFYAAFGIYWRKNCS